MQGMQKSLNVSEATYKQATMPAAWLYCGMSWCAFLLIRGLHVHSLGL